jgi:hypothetical protein
VDASHKDQNNLQKALTSIHGMYTLYATLENYSEVDQIKVNNFWYVIAEIALAVANRNSQSFNEVNHQ